MQEAEILEPLPTPDGSSLQEKVNTFLDTLDKKDVLEVLIASFSSAKYGTNKTFVGTVVYITDL